MSQLLVSKQALLQAPALKLRVGLGLRSLCLSSASLASTLSVQRRGAFGSQGLPGSEIDVGSVTCSRRRCRSVTMAAVPGLFPHPDSTLLYAMEFILAASGPLQLYNEATFKKNMAYAKFGHGGDGMKATIPSKTGMFFFYFPAAVIASVFFAYRVGLLPLASLLESLPGASGAASFLHQAVMASDDRLLLVAGALCVHFVKRCLEVLFVHKFSGSLSVEDGVVVATSYAIQTCLLLYSQLLSAGLEAPTPDLKWLGVALFLVGITGNGYHHWMLAHLRKDGNKKYVVPQGGLFGLLVCPHYVFEVIDFVGMALISQTLYGWCMASFTICYLTGRTLATKQWYKKKVEGFPEGRSILIPGIF